MTCKGYKTKCFYYQPRRTFWKLCINYNTTTKQCNLKDPTYTDPSYRKNHLERVQQ